MAYPTTTKLSAPQRLSDGTVTTIAALADEGRIVWRESKAYNGAPYYVAELTGSREPSGAYCGWRVGKLAYLSRTGGDIPAAIKA